MSCARCQVRLVDVSVRYDDAVPIFENITIHVAAGWTGIVGPNGAGKTTLLRLLGGQLAPHAGQRRCDPHDAAVHLCEQVCDARTPGSAIQEFAWAFDRRAIQWMDRLRLDVEHLERWATLSPGERKRWQIGAALHADPDVLLLDEPTNHVDMQTQELLVTALAEFDGVGLVVSHDREFLDAVTTATVRVRVRRPGTPAVIERFDGGYSRARVAWRHQASEAQSARDKATNRVRRLVGALQHAQEHRAQKEAHKRKVLRTSSHRDHDAHSSSSRGRLSHAVDRASSAAGLTRDSLARARDRLAAHRVDIEHAGRVAFVADDAPSSILMDVDPASVRVADRFLRGPRLWLERGQHVWLAGRSGAGKSTLAAALRQGTTFDPARCFVLPQDLPPSARREALAAVEALEPTMRGEVLSVVANLGCDPDRVRASALPSPGQARKLLLGLAVASDRWALVLDEPSNDLDLPAIERLESALRAYPGALLLITHDPRLAQATCDHAWTIEDDGQVLVRTLSTSATGARPGR